MKKKKSTRESDIDTWDIEEILSKISLFEK